MLKSSKGYCRKHQEELERIRLLLAATTEELNCIHKDLKKVLKEENQLDLFGQARGTVVPQSPLFGPPEALGSPNTPKEVSYHG